MVSCGVRDKGGAGPSRQNIGNVIPQETILTGDNYALATEVCNVFRGKREALMRGDYTALEYATSSTTCNSTSYSNPVNVETLLNADDFDTFSVIPQGGNVLRDRNIETDRDGMLSTICGDIEYNINAADNLKRTILVQFGSGNQRFHLSFSTRAGNYFVEKGHYTLTDGSFINKKTEWLTISNSSSNRPGFVRTKETLQECSGGIQRFRQSIIKYN